MMVRGVECKGMKPCRADDASITQRKHGNMATYNTVEYQVKAKKGLVQHQLRI
jgi:hypothetical protein